MYVRSKKSQIKGRDKNFFRKGIPGKALKLCQSKSVYKNTNTVVIGFFYFFLIEISIISFVDTGTCLGITIKSSIHCTSWIYPATEYNYDIQRTPARSRFVRALNSIYDIFYNVCVINSVAKIKIIAIKFPAVV